MIKLADTTLTLATGLAPKPWIVFEANGALPPIKLAQIGHGSGHQWLFRIGAYEHQEAYDSKRAAVETAERLLFTLFRDIADEQVLAAIRRGDTALAMRYAERRTPNAEATGRGAKRKRSCISSP